MQLKVFLLVVYITTIMLYGKLRVRHLDECFKASIIKPDRDLHEVVKNYLKTVSVKKVAFLTDYSLINKYLNVNNLNHQLTLSNNTESQQVRQAR